MPLNTLFDARNLSRFEALLLAHPVAQACSQGRLYVSESQRLIALTLTRDLDTPLCLDSVTLGRLCMIPDGSLVTATRIAERESIPPGIGILARHAHSADSARNKVVVYCSEEGTALWIDDWRVPGTAVIQPAPSCFMSVAFGFMAITAYRLGLTRIGVICSGRGPFQNGDGGASTDYAVWPRLGFDAAVPAAEIDRYPDRALSRAPTIQELRRAAPGWWEDHGIGRSMSFDLAAGSRSWSILLNYLYAASQERCTVTAAKSVQGHGPARYEIAAALHRARVIANRTPDPDEILPVDGTLRASLTRNVAAKESEAAMFGKACIDIPEVRGIRHKRHV